MAWRQIDDKPLHKPMTTQFNVERFPVPVCPKDNLKITEFFNVFAWCEIEGNFDLREGNLNSAARWPIRDKIFQDIVVS